MLKNHPRGLMVLFFTEMWERFGFYIMMAILTLYMDKSLGWGDKWKGIHYGVFLGAVYFIPILGGYLGDRVLGQRGTIRLGAVLMTIGYVALAVSSRERLALFYAGLALVAAGTGLFKANISVLVGNLYEEGSKFKDAAFNIFYMGINMGAAAAPLAATAIGNYNLSFAAAAVGMVVSMAIFQLGSRYLMPRSYGLAAGRPANVQPEASNSPPGEDRQRIVSLIILFAIVIFFWIAFYQNASSMTLFAERSTVTSRILKAETYQFFNPFFIVVLTPLLLAGFARLRDRGREPSSASKICMGLFILGLSVLVMAFASLAGGNRDENIMSPLWLIGSYFLVTVAEINVSPMGLSFVSKVAPQRIRGLMMGCWFGATATGSLISGLLAGYYSEFAHHQFFLMIAVLPFLASLLVLPFLKRLNRFSR
jgi:POT family proton-dependent oligopeptide transporter